MIYCRIFSVFALLLILLTDSARAGNTATATITATAIRPLHIERKSPLIFGYINNGTHGGTVSVNAATGRRVFSGDVRAQTQNDHARALFAVRGDKKRFYHIHLPSRVTATKAGEDSPVLEVRNLSAFSMNRGNTGVLGLLDDRGSDELYVGGELVVPQGAADGMYKAQFEVTVTYD